ncbi:HNH endonuclease [Bacteroides thetaiotaomicron]|uniref:HNH endonuclease n=1 Tax=Bacteroides thetaiotaomicron TaxID=818 RepID=UPI001F257B58|nr:HNH endonuclease [Bacteroides thetaiotaomicron]MCE8952144.1 NUMOD4 motif-containing HNH endonuclease [Bacteroides thetaiotaomicron]MCE8969489.1 NUMOD4 motif-containing HNH endonuclease [Bacteroides thetaiotaomicron]
MENWRFIEANSDYMISDHGRILSFKGKSKLIISSTITSKGYEHVAIRQKGIYVGYSVHRLVATAFIPNPKRLPQVNHLDGNKLNNHVANLEWCDAYDNIMHAIRTGLRPSSPALSPVPCATTDKAGNILQAYPSMNALVKGEQMSPKQRNWLVLHLLHPERLKQSAMKKKPRAERSGSEDCFLIAPEIPVLTIKADSVGEFEAGNSLGIGKSSNSIGEFKAGNVCVQPVSFSFVSSPFPLISLFAPIHHSVTQHYYRRLSPEESAIFGFNTYILPRERGQRKEFLQ